MSAWQSIATAPKDGRPVLLWVTYGAAFRVENEAVTARWRRPGGKPGPKEYWALVQAGGYAEDDEVSGEPTHWAELPPAPH